MICRLRSRGWIASRTGEVIAAARSRAIAAGPLVCVNDVVPEHIRPRRLPRHPLRLMLSASARLRDSLSHPDCAPPSTCRGASDASREWC